MSILDGSLRKAPDSLWWTGKAYLLAALLAQPQPPALALQVVVVDVHVHDGRHPREAVDHHPEQRLVGQTSDGRRVDRVDKQPHFPGLEDRRLAPLHDVGRSPHGIVKLTLRPAQCRDEHSPAPLPSASLSARNHQPCRLALPQILHELPGC